MTDDLELVLTEDDADESFPDVRNDPVPDDPAPTEEATE